MTITAAAMKAAYAQRLSRCDSQEVFHTMLQVYHWTQGTEFAQARHAEMLADAQSQRTARRAVRHQRAHLRAQVRFFRLYHLRRLLFRFAPGLADRVAL